MSQRSARTSWNVALMAEGVGWVVFAGLILFSSWTSGDWVLFKDVAWVHKIGDGIAVLLLVFSLILLVNRWLPRTVGYVLAAVAVAIVALNVYMQVALPGPEMGFVGRMVLLAFYASLLVPPVYILRTHPAS